MIEKFKMFYKNLYRKAKKYVLKMSCRVNLNLRLKNKKKY